MAVPCNKEYEIGQIEAYQAEMREDIREIKACLKDVKENLVNLNLRVALIASGISAALCLLAWASKLLFS